LGPQAKLDIPVGKESDVAKRVEIGRATRSSWCGKQGKRKMTVLESNVVFSSVVDIERHEWC
jgi:hypothetical protein